jgi:hypothetical protein
LELQKANFSLASIREHIAKHDEHIAMHKKEFEHVSPIRKLRQKRRQTLDKDNNMIEGAARPVILPPLGSQLGSEQQQESTSLQGIDSGDEASVNTKSFITEGRSKRRGKRLKTKLNEKIKNELAMEKILRNKGKLEMNERMRRKEEFSDNVKKHKMPSPRRLPGLGLSHDIATSKANLASPVSGKSPRNNVSSITQVRVLEDLGSLVVSQLQVSPRIPPMGSPRASAANLSKVSPRELVNSNSSFRVADNSGILGMDDNDDLHDILSLQQEARENNPFGLKYEYPAHISGAAENSSSSVEDLINGEPSHYTRAEWVTQLLASDPEEDNLAEVYEAGFSMYLAEKGIELEK